METMIPGTLVVYHSAMGGAAKLAAAIARGLGCAAEAWGRSLSRS